MVALNQVWVVEYSKRQAQFHIDTLDVVVQRNAEAYVSDTDADRDYVPIAVADSHEAAKKMMADLKKMADRKKIRGQ